MPEHPILPRISSRIQELMTRSLPDRPNAGLLAALSGGPDSVALLLAARHWSRATGRPLAAAHLNHQLRGDDADQDEAFCRDLCARMEIPLFEHREDPRPLARQRGMGLEEAGRHLRRRFFLNLLADHPELHAVATGHHLDDQAETVVMRLFRGTGLDGLRGMRPAQDNFIRPLLEVTRADILAFLENCGQTYRTDATNLSGDNTRSRLRRELLPLARDIFGPGCDLAPARLASLLDPELDLLEDLSQAAQQNVCAAGDDKPTLAVDSLLALDAALARRVLKKWLTGPMGDWQNDPGGDVASLELVHVDGILKWLQEGQSGSGIDLPGNWRLVREFDTLRLEPGIQSGLPLRSATDFRILVQSAIVGPENLDPAAPDRQIQDDCWELVCPSAVLQGNLQVRHWHPGDRMQPFGLDGRKKLSDLFRENRIPAGARDQVLVVSDDKGILWVVGMARADRTRMLPSTRQAVTIRVVRRDTPSG